MKKLLTCLVIISFFQCVVKAQNKSIVYLKEGIPLNVLKTSSNSLVELNKEDSLFSYNIAVAEFEAGKKLAWHYHPGGQVLIITEGAGFYQERGKPKRLVKKGEVIKCMPNVEHWHGASLESGVAIWPYILPQKVSQYG